MAISKQRILLVEDNDAMRDGVRDILELAGYDVMTAGDGDQALALMGTHTPDLIISDIMMPQMDGYQLYDSIRQNRAWNAVPFIFLTAKGERADVRMGKQLGADDYLTKPFDSEDLLVAVEGKLKRSRQLETFSVAAINDLKSSIVRTLSHEFRTPLTFIQGYSELLEMSGPGIDINSFQEFLRGIRRGSERLNRLVEDFLLLVRLETNQMEEAMLANQGEVSLADMVHNAARTRASQAAEAHITVSVTAEPGLIVRTNPVYATDILTRLLDNAIKFSRGRAAQVWMHAFREGDTARIDVVDHGVGMASGELPHLFNVLQQINRSQYEQQGAGLGLAIAHGLVQVLGGQMLVTSAEGVGSTFSLVLPLTNAGEA